MNVCALVPVYNESRFIGEVVKGCLHHVSVVYVVDDGSTDGSGAIAQQAGATVLRHPTNRGKGVALKTGFGRILREGRCDGVVTLDGDRQHDWNEIPKFLAYMQERRCDIVVGNRMGDVHIMPFRRRATNFLSSRVLSLITGQRIEDSQCGFRLIRTGVLKGLVLKTTDFDTESEMLVEAARRGARIGNLRIATIYGTETSSIRPIRDTWRFVRLAGRYLLQAERKRTVSKRNETC